MDLQIVNPTPKYQPVKLIEPPPLGYIHVAAAVEPSTGRIPLPGSSPDKKALLTRLKDLTRQLENLPEVIRATVYRGILIPPPGGYAKQATHPARYDVAVLVETTAPEMIGKVHTSEPYKLLLEAVQGAAKDLHVMAAHCIKRVGDVDKTRQGLFLFDYFVAEDPQVALRLWDHLAGWYAVETGMDNSTLLAPIGDADYVFVNHLRWNYGLPVSWCANSPSPRSEATCWPTCGPTGPAPCRCSTGSLTPRAAKEVSLTARRSADDDSTPAWSPCCQDAAAVMTALPPGPPGLPLVPGPIPRPAALAASVMLKPPAVRTGSGPVTTVWCQRQAPDHGRLP